MFKVGDYIVYGMNGVCKVEEIGPMNLSGVESDKEYYTLTPFYTKGSRVFTPVDNQKVPMRTVISRTEACKLIDSMKQIEEIEVADDKHREIAYKEAIKSCDCIEWIRIINTAQKRKEERLAQGKKMSACDERYLKSARDNLYGEFAISLDLEKDEVEEYIEHRIAMKDMASAS
ncbi:MAG: CarD family transcriptional regulator [Clostridium sp.]|nr:CarD family transcriptional regulator [Clostridium sp.]